MDRTGSTRILLIGLAGAGKTTLGTVLSERLGLQVHGLDDLRRSLSDGTVAGEALARSAFVRSCGLPGPAVYEFSAAGSHRATVRQALGEAGCPLVTAWIDTPSAVRRARLAARPDTVPLPNWGDRQAGVEETMEATLRSDFEIGWWAELPGWRALRLDGTRPSQELAHLVEDAWRDAGGRQ